MARRHVNVKDGKQGFQRVARRAEPPPSDPVPPRRADAAGGDPGRGHAPRGIKGRYSALAERIARARMAGTLGKTARELGFTVIKRDADGWIDCTQGGVATRTVTGNADEALRIAEATDQAVSGIAASLRSSAMTRGVHTASAAHASNTSSHG